MNLKLRFQLFQGFKLFISKFDERLFNFFSVFPLPIIILLVQALSSTRTSSPQGKLAQILFRARLWLCVHLSNVASCSLSSVSRSAQCWCFGWTLRVWMVRTLPDLLHSLLFRTQRGGAGSRTVGLRVWCSTPPDHFHKRRRWCQQQQWLVAAGANMH